MKRINQSPDVRDILIMEASIDGDLGLTIFASIETEDGWYGVHFATEELCPVGELNDTRLQLSISNALFGRLLPTATLIPDAMARALWPYLKEIVSRAERAKGILIPVTTTLYFGRRIGEPIQIHEDQRTQQLGVATQQQIDRWGTPLQTVPTRIHPDTGEQIEAGIRSPSTLLSAWMEARNQPTEFITQAFTYSELIFMQTPEFQYHQDVRTAMRWLEENSLQSTGLPDRPGMGIEIEPGTIDLDAGTVEATPAGLTPLNPVDESYVQTGETLGQYAARMRAMTPIPRPIHPPSPGTSGPLPLPVNR